MFSNAVIQWLPNQDILIKRFSEWLNKNGVLAVQLPLFFDMPLGKSIAMIGQQPKWASATQGVKELFTIHHKSFYYNHLVKYFKNINIWITDYYHVMDSHEAILAMIRSTGLKPYLERIPDDNEKHEFENQILDSIRKDYPQQEDGKVLFPFKRLFFVAEKE